MLALGTEDGTARAPGSAEGCTSFYADISENLSEEDTILRNYNDKSE